ncbi:hypothetical protein NP233_g8 [Leucocoprinus birnbaumii]|uniref:Uncharacterized protein n=1 Tax=Leucocoprinus birnbaumii TaxID=56174 RepID=A0AAD5W4V4_9AGAR|nr:hypothetical protein NP233_g8 [Leucocoprinus birnbaumii]
MLGYTQDWEIEQHGVPSDHKLVSVQLAKPNTPFIGRGRWTIPKFVLSDRKYLQEVESLGRKLVEKMQKTHDGIEVRTDRNNPQVLMREWKETIINKAKERAKRPPPYIERKINVTKAAIDIINADVTLNKDERNLQSAHFKEELKELHQKQEDALRGVTAASDQIYGETVCKPWIDRSKGRPSRELIYKLENPRHANDHTKPKYETKTKNMAEIARTYHESLQTADCVPEQDQEREKAIEEVLKSINDVKLSNNAKAKMAEYINRLEVEMALQSSSNGKAPGLDGIPYELWKILSV